MADQNPNTDTEKKMNGMTKLITSGFTGIFDFAANAMARDEERRVNAENAAALNRSAAMEDQNAAMARIRGGTAAGRRRMAASALGGTQKVAYAMGSIDANSGTAAATSSSSAIFAELDAQTLQNNAVREAFGHEESARKYRADSQKLKDYASRESERRGLYAAGEFLKMGTNVASALGGGK